MTRCSGSVLLLALLCLFGSTAFAESPYPLVPASFEVPLSLETDHFRLRKLTIHDVVKDYDALMNSFPHARSKDPDAPWPAHLTVEENLIDLAWHQKEFENRTSFVYTVVTLDETMVVGCVYINPTRKVGFDVEVRLWTRPAEQFAHIDEAILKRTVEQWLRQSWPFESPGFAGIDIPMDEWASIQEVKR
jgi:hypothetical protein